MNCKICGGKTEILFEKKVLGKYPAQYHKCLHCSFLQIFDHPWLDEAYTSAITSLDIGLVMRNLEYAPRVMILIDYLIKSKNKQFLDYGGGYGLFVRLMRDKGYEFYRYDKYCDNLFAASFDYEISTLATDGLDLVTAFEVFEHISDPLNELEQMLTYSDNIFFSTELQPKNEKDISGWWYISPEIGQHISFYSEASLKFLAKKYELNFYSDGKYFHLFTKEKISPFLFSLLTTKKLSAFLWFLKSNRKSLLASDYKKLKDQISTT